MENVSGFPYFEVEFNKKGDIHDEDKVKNLVDFLSQSTVTDLFVISHGWNNEMDEARDLYRRFFAHVREELTNNRPPEFGTREFAVFGILWPSKKFADEDDTAGGAASIDDMQSQDEQIEQQLEALKGIFDRADSDEKLERAKQLIPLLELAPNAASEFADLIRSLPDKRDLHPDDASDDFFQIPASTLIDKLSRPDIPVPEEGEEGGAASFDPAIGPGDAGGAAGFDLFGGIKPAIRKVLNYTTYFQMKERAGIVGQTGVYQVMRRILQKKPGLKIHLIGHSFGGRLVTSVANGLEGLPPIKAHSMTLLQAAFSHNGFAENFDGERDGFFRKVVTESRVAGPIIITHSIEDRAVGIAYPIASKLSGDDAATFGGPDSRFGGIGRNGAQLTPEADNSTPLGAQTATYSFKAGKLYNLNADAIITGHSDIARGEIAHALLSAIAAT